MSASQNPMPHSSAWVGLTYVSFVGAAFMVGVGIFFLPLDWWSRGYLAMGVIALVQSCVTLTKTLRDQHEAARLMNRIEDARTERLLMEAGRSG